MKWFAYLSGEHESFPLSELKAIAEAYGSEMVVESLDDQVVVFRCRRDVVRKMCVRAAYTHFIAELSQVTDYSVGNIVAAVKEVVADLDKVELVCYRVKEHGRGFFRMNELVSKLEEAIRQLGKDVTPGGSKVAVLVSGSGVYIGKVVCCVNRGSFQLRRPRQKPVFHPSSLDPYLSRLFVNLSRAKEGDVVLDPFCGVGGILVEACILGIEAFGIDISRFMVRGAQLNTEYYCGTPSHIVHGDVRAPPLRQDSIDAIATDPPYGRSASTGGEDVRVLYRKLLELVSTALKVGKYAAFAHPAELRDYVNEVMDELGLKLVEDHYMKVHGGLTRRILVVRRVA